MVSEELTIDIGDIISYKPVDPSFLLIIIQELFNFFLYIPQKRKGETP